MIVEVEFGEEVAQGDAEEGTGGEGEDRAREGTFGDGSDSGTAQKKEDRAQGDEECEGDVDEMRGAPGDARADHEAGEGEGVGRFVKDGGEEDTETG